MGKTLVIEMDSLDEEKKGDVSKKVALTYVKYIFRLGE